MSQQHILTGRISAISPQQTAGTFSFREAVVDTDDGQYSQLIAFQFSGKNIDAPTDYRVGDAVKITFNIRGRQSNGKYYVSLVGFKIERG